MVLEIGKMIQFLEGYNAELQSTAFQVSKNLMFLVWANWIDTHHA